MPNPYTTKRQGSLLNSGFSRSTPPDSPQPNNPSNSSRRLKDQQKPKKEAAMAKQKQNSQQVQSNPTPNSMLHQGKPNPSEATTAPLSPNRNLSRYNLQTRLQSPTIQHSHSRSNSPQSRKTNTQETQEPEAPTPSNPKNTPTCTSTVTQPKSVQPPTYNKSQTGTENAGDTPAPLSPRRSLSRSNSNTRLQPPPVQHSNSRNNSPQRKKANTQETVAQETPQLQENQNHCPL